MLGIGGGEEMGITPSSNEWPQQTTVGDWPVTGNSATAGTAGCAAARDLASEMGRPRPDEQQQLLQLAGPLRCPRCDSSNTKFCYYNNYSLAQPRHFCKACKRYWTRGGTLRNVPVGGGCRKNKRARKPSPSDPPPAATVAPAPPSRPTELNPFLYADISSLAFPSIRAVQEGNISNPCAAYDLQNQLSALGVGFAPEEYQPRFGTDQSHLQQSAMMSSAASLSHDYSLFDSSLSPATAASLLLVSSLKPPTKTDGYQGSLPYEHLQTAENGNPVGAAEANADGCNRIDWPLHCENPFQALAAAADSRDSQFLYWNAMAGASWPDESNLESSVASLI